MFSRSVVLFTHVTGVLVLFIGIALEWLTTRRKRCSSVPVDLSRHHPHTDIGGVENLFGGREENDLRRVRGGQQDSRHHTGPPPWVPQGRHHRARTRRQDFDDPRPVHRRQRGRRRILLSRGRRPRCRGQGSLADPGGSSRRCDRGAPGREVLVVPRRPFVRLRQTSVRKFSHQPYGLVWRLKAPVWV